jgi:hypothetical protein
MAGQAILLLSSKASYMTVRIVSQNDLSGKWSWLASVILPK